MNHPDFCEVKRRGIRARACALYANSGAVSGRKEQLSAIRERPYTFLQITLVGSATARCDRDANGSGPVSDLSWPGAMGHFRSDVAPVKGTV